MMQLATDYEKGLPGDPDSETRYKQLEAATLARYGAETTDALSVSFAGLSLDAGGRCGMHRCHAKDRNDWPSS